MREVTAYLSDDGILYADRKAALAWDAELARRAEREARRKVLEDAIPTFSADEAWAKMNEGIWMTCGGSTLRNRVSEDGTPCGEYCVMGDLPGCVRACDVNTLATVRGIRSRWRELLGPDGKRQWPVVLDDEEAR